MTIALKFEYDDAIIRRDDHWLIIDPHNVIATVQIKNVVQPYVWLHYPSWRSVAYSDINNLTIFTI